MPNKKLATGNARIIKAIKYLLLCNTKFKLSGNLQWRILNTFRSKVIASRYSPRGQIQPQKTRPISKEGNMIMTKSNPFHTPTIET
ncbi:MAG: hypothetical protein NWE95_00875 [Candidatus Bathyarchaeota archaeon]|nr:hypothetical protein [Candidatus Bathyarchaeota archaeon]